MVDKNLNATQPQKFGYIYAASLANVTLPVKILLDNAKIVLTVSYYNGSNCGVTLICVLPVSVCMSPVDPQKR